MRLYVNTPFLLPFLLKTEGVNSFFCACLFMSGIYFVTLHFRLIDKGMKRRYIQPKSRVCTPRLGGVVCTMLSMSRATSAPVMSKEREVDDGANASDMDW